MKLLIDPDIYICCKNEDLIYNIYIMVEMTRGEESILAQGRLLELVTQEVMINGKVKTFEFARRAPGVRLIVSALDNS